MRNRLTLVLLLLFSLDAVAHSVVQKGDQYVVSHEWEYNARKWNCSINVPVRLYRYYQGRAHMSDDMVPFVLSDYDRSCVRGLVDSFREGGDLVGYKDKDNLLNVVRFVQSLHYVTDLESKRVRDYVRFPMETLVDGEGDCEDLSILAATILHEMGYRVLLVVLPDHLALAVDCGDDFEGTYYVYEGSKYYYLEVTNTGWSIGQIPDEFRNSRATLVPLAYRPRLRLMRSSYQHDSYYSYEKEVPFLIRCELENQGPGQTEGLSVRVIFRTHRGVPAVERVYYLDELQEGESSSNELNVIVPRPFWGEIEIRAEGNNFLDPEPMFFENIELE